MTPDFAASATYLAALDSNADAFTFQYFAERPGSTVNACHPHAAFPLLADLLGGVNAGGGGIFVTVNQTDGEGRSTANVTAIRSLFIDCDRPRTRRLALPPSLSVATSPGRGHHYWLLRSGEPLELFRGAQERLAAYYGTDPTVIDLGRVLRLPGFFHVKAEPFLVAIVRHRPDVRYTIAEVLAVHSLPAGICAARSAPADRPCAETAYRSWSRQAPFTAGSRNRVAYRIAIEGFTAGLADAIIEAEVHAFCVESGIASEAPAVLRHARRAAAHALRHSSSRAGATAAQSRPAK